MISDLTKGSYMLRMERKEEPGIGKLEEFGFQGPA